MNVRTLSLLALALSAALAAGCVTTDRCYLHVSRYERMSSLFAQTGSLQRVIDAMEDDEWANCERNEVLYRLRKDYFLSEEDLALIPPGREPDTAEHKRQHARRKAAAGDDKDSGLRLP